MKSGLLFLNVGLITEVATLRNQPELATAVTSRIVRQNAYDFIISGGGVSGLTVADQLIEDSSVKVLFIDAGPFDKNEDFVLVPGAFSPSYICG
ncbi:hypothetical protein MFIFM68171_10178 [Madurella fahalii]|uniref:Glucose-methanol-choline oxidoreductase N-terminal domain-containing protein n=1 Tax=Madurella fahalii TaxID=1157608 RepID=A0ABQ0GQG6_9PEZI